MHLTRLLSTCAVAIAMLGVARAESADDVCAFESSKLYVRDAKQFTFPAGYLPCESAGSRCDKCDCRALQTGKSGAKAVTWALCIESSDSCVSPQAPDRKWCGAALTGAGGNATASSYEPGTTHTYPESGPKIELEQQALDANTGIATKSQKGNTSTILVAGCAVAGVAGIAMFALANKKKKQGKELGTPRQDKEAGYKDTDTSKARSKSLQNANYPQGQGRDSGNNYGVDPIAASHQQMQPQGRHSHERQSLEDYDVPPMGDHQDSSSTSDEELEDEFTTFGSDDNKPQSFSAFDTIRGSDIDLQTNMSMAYDVTEDDDEYYGDDADARLSDESSEGEASPHGDGGTYRDSDDMMLSNSSALSYYEDEGSPRKSIEF